MTAKDFVREHTRLTEVPLVPEIRLFTATEITPLWHATASWLGARGIDVPFWSTPWAGGQALARFILDGGCDVRDKRVVDFGTGSGLVAIAAALAGACGVRAIDIDPFACAACELNAAANGVAVEAICADVVPKAIETDVLLAADVWYERAAAERFEPWLRSVAASGAMVLSADPGRAYVPSRARVVATYMVPTSRELESTDARRTTILELSV